jgi:hypothetical protein
MQKSTPFSGGFLLVAAKRLILVFSAILSCPRNSLRRPDTKKKFRHNVKVIAIRQRHNLHGVAEPQFSAPCL